MGQWNHKSVIYILFVVFMVEVFSLLISGCSDNPEAKADKKMRDQIAEAVQESVAGKDYDAAKSKVMASLQQNRSQGLTKDAGLLASGNLALAQAQQMRVDLGPKVLQLRTSTNELEKTLRASESLLLEKEKVEMLLSAGDQEIVDLGKLLDGDGQTEGLNKQLAQIDAQMQHLLTEKESLQGDRDRVQAVLDEFQGNADSLRREAELAKGDTRLDLEKQAFAILQQRKDHYVEAQSLENQIAVLDDKIALIQVQFDGLTQDIQEIEQRIEDINSSSARASLKQQKREIQGAISDSQNSLSAISKAISTAFREYLKASDELLSVNDEAIGEFEKIRSREAAFSATVRLADGAYHAAASCAELIKNQKDLAERLQDLLDTADPVFISAMQSNLPIQQDVNAGYKKKAFDYFDQAIQTYEEASSQAGPLETDAKCSLLKSKLLALYGKMQLADLLGEFDLANSTETAMQGLIQKGTELGSCFTQSEAMRVVANEGIGYLPSLPLNMEVFIEGKKQEFSVWKQLPVSQQSAAVEKNLLEIERLVSEYGQDLARQLEPLKQEMLSAKEAGFESTTSNGSTGTPSSSTPSTSNTFGDPNSF